MRRLAAASTLLVLLLTVAASAQIADPDTLYDRGTVGLSYAQTPFPWYSGTFLASGPALQPDGTWPPGVDAVAGGGITALDPDTVVTAIYGITENPDGTFDGALALLKTVGQPTPGSYAVDLTNGTAIFGFIDDAANFDLPDTLSQEAIIAWLENLPAAHKLASISGTIAISTVGADTLDGTFQGLCADADNPLFLVNVTGGHFELSGAEATAVPRTPGPGQVALAARPNPFNPRTVVALTVPRAGSGEVTVYDLRGRPVRRLHTGELRAGRQAWTWNGRDDTGRVLPSGVYLVRARTPAGPVRAKVVLAK